MSHIYRELKPIPIPDFCLINRGNGRVFISTRTKDNRRNQLVLGRAVKDPVTGTLSLMYPNDTFRMRYPAEWAKVYGEPRLPFEFHIGLYCATLAIGRSTGLYDILQEAMGPKNGNAVMDYAMFLLRSRSNTTQLFAEPCALKHSFRNGRMKTLGTRSCSVASPAKKSMHCDPVG